MIRYFTRPRAAWHETEASDFDKPLLRSDLLVPEHEATDTGLIDKNGDSIMRAPNAMGFGADL